MNQESLYKRIGAYDAIAAITDDFLIRLIAHEQMKRFFFGASESTRIRRRQHIVDFLCNETGGPCAYTGRNMKDAHKGLGISERDWNTLSDLFQESLNKFKLQPKEFGEVMALISSRLNKTL
jgi:hemoglobin